MSSPITMIAAVAAAFLLGSIPSGLWTGRAARGIDVRTQGSGNLGATNVYRVLGPRWGLTVLLLDALKGAVAVWVARALVPDAPVAAGFAGMAGAFFGHMFTPFAGFRGGKGVATAAGSWGALVPLALAAALAVWIALFAATRIVSIASVAAAAVLPIAVALTGHATWADPYLWLSVLTALFILVRHRSNLARLRRGEEKALSLRGPGERSPGR